MSKNVLIVMSHPERTSFNGALVESAITALTKQGHRVEVSDLYGMDFNPIYGRHDVKGASTEEEDSFDYCLETANAVQSGGVADDILEEQRKLDAADLVIFQFPMCWSGMPAMMKGYFDRVMSFGYAFTDQNIYDRARFREKKSILSFTTGGPSGFYSPDGLHGDMNLFLWPMQSATLHCVGFQVLAPQISYAPGLVTPAERQEMLSTWEKRLANVWDEQSLYFVPLAQFDLKDQSDPLKGLILRKDGELEQRLTETPYGATLGQHLGRPLPPNSQMEAPKVARKQTKTTSAEASISR